MFYVIHNIIFIIKEVDFGKKRNYLAFAWKISSVYVRIQLLLTSLELCIIFTGTYIFLYCFRIETKTKISTTQM